MPKNVTKIRLFVASPSDVSEERMLVSQICDDLNKGIGRQRDIVIEVVMWETHVVPAAGRPQQVVFDSVGEDIDIFVAIFWKRFGTPTGVAGSGSEEEARWAYDKWSKTGRPRLMFYFRSSGPLPGRNDFPQYQKVVTFMEEVQGQALTWTYGSPDQFKEQFRHHMEGILLRDQPLNSSVTELSRDRSLVVDHQVLSPTKANIRFWDDPSVYSESAHLLGYRRLVRRIQNIPTGMATREVVREDALITILERLHHMRTSEGLWESGPTRFDKLYVTTSVLYFLLQLGFRMQDRIIALPLDYLDSVRRSQRFSNPMLWCGKIVS